MDAPAYASFNRRYRALVIDFAVLAGALLVIVILSDLARHVPGSGRVAVVALYALILYEPILVWRYGATIGHRATNLRVVDDVSGGNPGFFKALARFVIKTLLGIISFVTMATTRRYQAVHDAMTHTTVQLRDVDRARPGDYYEARTEPTDFIMPSRLRRVVVIVLYLVALFFALGVVAVAFSHSKFAQAILGPIWLGLNALIIIAGWRGGLFGCRRTRAV